MDTDAKPKRTNTAFKISIKSKPFLTVNCF